MNRRSLWRAEAESLRRRFSASSRACGDAALDVEIANRLGVDHHGTLEALRLPVHLARRQLQLAFPRKEALRLARRLLTHATSSAG